MTNHIYFIPLLKLGSDRTCRYASNVKNTLLNVRLILLLADF